jgi:hypothetical protein
MKNREIEKIKTLTEANIALMELSKINAELEALKAKQLKEEIARMKNMEKHTEEAAPILKEKGRLLKMLEDFAVKNREKVFADDQSLKLTNGRIGFQKSKKAIAKRGDNPFTEAEIAKQIFDEIGEACVQQKFEMKKEEIKKRFTEADLNKYGLYIYQREAFFAEDKFGVRF